MIKIDPKNCLKPVIGPNGLQYRDLFGRSSETKAVLASLRRQRDRGKLGFFDLPYQTAAAKKISETAKNWRGKFDNFVVVGIGGSALGNIALQSALRHPNWNLLSREARKGYLRLFVPDNVDPTLIRGLLDVIDLRRTLFNVVSKSGSTAECLANYFILRKAVEKKMGASRAREHFVFTTDPEKGFLREVSRR